MIVVQEGTVETLFLLNFQGRKKQSIQRRPKYMRVKLIENWLKGQWNKLELSGSSEQDLLYLRSYTYLYIISGHFLLT